VAGIWRENFGSLTNLEYQQERAARRATHAALRRIVCVLSLSANVRQHARRARLVETGARQRRGWCISATPA